MAAFLHVLAEYKIADIAILMIGLFGAVLIVDRFKALFLDYSMPVGPFMEQITRLIQEDKIDEAVTFCAANKDKPLAQVIKRILERSDRDQHSIEKSYDIATTEVAPRLVKNLNHLPMIGNVVTMVGLFGTVIGLILAFQAIALADPSQKQTLLAQGISAAMTATAAGLAVAIPVMFIYSFLYTRQTAIFSEIDQNAGKVLEMLRDRTYRPFGQSYVYPSIANENFKSPTPPTPNGKGKAS